MSCHWYSASVVRVCGIPIVDTDIVVGSNHKFADDDAFVDWIYSQLASVSSRQWQVFNVVGKVLFVADGDDPERELNPEMEYPGPYEDIEIKLQLMALPTAPKDYKLCAELLQVAKTLTGRDQPKYFPGEWLMMSNDMNMMAPLELPKSHKRLKTATETDDKETQETKVEIKPPSFHPAFRMCCDVEFSVRGERIGCSRLLLSMNNEVPERMLSNKWKRPKTDADPHQKQESRANELDNFDPVCFKVYLDAVCKLPDLTDLLARLRQLSTEQRDELKKISDFFLDDRVGIALARDEVIRKTFMEPKTKEDAGNKSKTPLLNMWKDRSSNVEVEMVDYDVNKELMEDYDKLREQRTF